MYSLVIKFIADYLVIFVALIGTASLLYLVKKNRLQVYNRLLMMGLTALLLAHLVSLVFTPDEQRPFMTAGSEPLAAYLNNPGFPSDHVLFVTVITGAVWVATGRRGIAATLLVMSLLVGLGRILALVHTPLDVIGGFVIALVAIATWFPRELFASKKQKVIQ